MKRYLSLLFVALIAVAGYQAKANWWIIGDVSPFGWTASIGTEMAADGDIYTADVEIMSTGDKYFSFTSALSGSGNWNDISGSRYGGSMTVTLGTETQLYQSTDSPKLSFSSTGIYTFEFNPTTHKVKVTKKSDSTKRILIDKASTGYIYAWCEGTDNYGSWPGTNISTLSTTTINGHEYYVYNFTHTHGGTKFIFNEGNGQPQTGDMAPNFGKVYKYTGGTYNPVPAMPAPRIYAISIQSMTNGNVTSDKSEAAIGETVTLTVAPAANYVLNTLTVTAGYESQGSSGGGRAPRKVAVWQSQGTITTTKVDDTHYTFVLPASLPNILSPNYNDNTQFRVSATFKVAPVTLEEALDGNRTSVELSDELTVVAVVGNHIYATDGDDNWIRVDMDATNVAAGMVMAGVSGTLENVATAPTLTNATATFADENVDVSNLIIPIDMESPIARPVPNSVARVTGYYFGGELRAYGSNSGQSITLDNEFASASFVDGARYTIVMALELKEAWAASGAPLRQVGDYDFQNIKGRVISSADVATGVEDVRVVNGKTVRYYDMNGRYIGTSLESAPAGIYFGSDGVKIRK